ncbi:MAG: hypothetical protein CMK36_08075 [Porticoccaceae bacterium]|nr:hypothetical protein [Porticoccaceae bacterium]
MRFKGSSGGALTALSLYCIDRERVHDVLHVGQSPENPTLDKAFRAGTCPYGFTIGGDFNNNIR